MDRHLGFEGSIDVICMDYMKAFDKVPHSRLIRNIESCGMDGNILGWISSFLTDRVKVAFQGYLSQWTPVTSEIPQGTVLGPLLFVIYLNDLPKVVSSELFLFMDDTKIFHWLASDVDAEQLQNIWIL